MLFAAIRALVLGAGEVMGPGLRYDMIPGAVCLPMYTCRLVRYRVQITKNRKFYIKIRVRQTILKLVNF